MMSDKKVRSIEIQTQKRLVFLNISLLLGLTFEKAKHLDDCVPSVFQDQLPSFTYDSTTYV